MSENNESHQAQAGAQAPRVARSASSQPLSGTEQSQAHENMAAASGGVKVREKARRGAPRARRMSLSLTRIDAWSAAKVAFMLSIAGGIIQIVAVTLLWLLLNVVGVFDQVTQIVSSTGLDAGGFDLANVLSLSTVLSAVTIFSIIEVVLFTVLGLGYLINWMIPEIPLTVAFAEVEVTGKVIGYLRTLLTGEVLDSVPLDMPEQTLPTRAVLYTLTPEALADAGVDAAAVPGALHAAEHAAIGLLPLVATCDRGDIGGVSTLAHPDTGLPTVFVYDGHLGGAGFAERGHEAFAAWIGATREAVSACRCASGCPSCVQSPKCGNGNEPLDKAGAIAVLTLIESLIGTG